MAWLIGAGSLKLNRFSMIIYYLTKLKVYDVCHLPDIF